MTVLIMSMILTAISAVLTSTRRSRDDIYNLQEAMLAGPAILDLVERDLRGLITFGIPEESRLRIQNRVLGGNDADSIDFLCTTDSRHWYESGARQARCDWGEVGYRLRPSPRNDDFFEIYRREDFGGDSYQGEAFDEGRYTFLHDRVKSFNIEVFAEDGEDAEPLEEWEGEAESEEEASGGLPARIEITMVIELAARISREGLPIAAFGRLERTYRRVIRLPESLRLDASDTPRLVIPPSPDEAAEDAASTDSDEGEESEDGGGGTSTGQAGDVQAIGGDGAGGTRGG